MSNLRMLFLFNDKNGEE
jgi:hypothetical protein